MTKHQGLFYFFYGYDAGMAVQIHRLPEISVDMAMAIIQTSVSGTRIIYAVHVAVFCYRPLADCTQDLQLTRWNHLPLCKCIPHQKQYNFESPMIKLCLSNRDTKNRISSALLFPFERKAPIV